MKRHAPEKGQCGFIMLYVIIASSVIFTLLGMSIQANHALHQTNQRHIRELTKRAATVTVQQSKE